VAINQRVINVYESLQIKQAEFARTIKISAQTLNNQVKGKNGLSLATLELIAKGYPNLNMRWLISGEGEKWINTYQENENTDNLIINEDPPQYKPEKKEIEESDLSKKRYELLLIEIEALRKRLEMVEQEVKKR
jgi:transcriptional regulator with XRE-family HTH domain